MKMTETVDAGESVLPSAESTNIPRASSLRSRPSQRAKRTVTFKEEQEEPTPQIVVTAKEGESWDKVRPACLGVLLAIALASIIVYFATPSIPTKPKLWTNEELARYNGTNNKPPLLLSILGSVFDVSKGWMHYGPDGGYHHFVGRDASRAFVSGNFTGDGLTDSLKGLSATQVKAIDDWRVFFLNRYIYLGKLIGTFYDAEGKPTKELRKVEKKTLQAVRLVEQQKADEEQTPNCNSRWSQDKGGEVWCNTGFYPRIVERLAEVPPKGPPGTRCACFEEEELKRPGLQEYEGCDARSSNCKAS